MDDWRIMYLQTGCKYVEPPEYLPCPGSASCAMAIKQAGKGDEEDEGPTYPRES